MTTIPIILAADNNYAPYMSVLMISILKNAKSNPFIDFYLLVPDSFDNKYEKLIQKDCKFYKNKQINFINIKNAFSNTKQMISHITKQTYYRLQAADILPEKYDKCVYLDIDTIVNNDLSELFSIDLEYNYVAGVRAPGYRYDAFPSKWNQFYAERIGIPSVDKYINAGVIVLNLKEIRANNLTSVLCEEALKNYPTQDQDVINKVFYNRIKILPFYYNAQTIRVFEEDEKLLKLFTKEEIDKTRKEPFIIHYSTQTKPWNDRKCIFANYWWKYAAKSHYYKKQLLKQNLKRIFSVSNSEIHKVFNILGIKIKFKNKKLIKKQEKEKLKTDISRIQKSLQTISKKQQDAYSCIQKTNYFISFSLNNNNNFSNNSNDIFNNFISFRYDYLDTPSQYGVNIGDYIQSIATLNVIKKLQPNTNIINFDRDNLGNYDNVPAFTIMQGWFSNSYTFLPNNRITPIYIGTHITTAAQRTIFNFLQYNPSFFEKEIIGCRDKSTQEYFTSLGIPNYLSRCLTLTLPKREKMETQNKIFLVNIQPDIIEKLPKNIKENAEIINQRIVDPNQNDIFYYNQYNKYIDEAKDLLEKYKKEAKLVITPALHCASPCIAMGIPVILIENDKNQNRLSVLDGIIKKYSADDFYKGIVDFNPASINIEDLKEAIIKNVSLSIQSKMGMNINSSEIKEIREYIQEYSKL